MPGTSKSTGPSWKPAKDAADDNYGQAVSEAAKAKPKPGKPSVERKQPKA